MNEVQGRPDPSWLVPAFGISDADRLAIGQLDGSGRLVAMYVCTYLGSENLTAPSS